MHISHKTNRIPVRFLFGLCVALASFSSVSAQTMQPLAFSSMQGWAEDRHEEAFAAFVQSCPHISTKTKAVKAAIKISPKALAMACNAAQNVNKPVTQAAARRFFEQHFQPFAVEESTARAFFTGYFEPELQGSRTQTTVYTMPLLQLPQGHSAKAITQNNLQFTAAHTNSAGKRIPYPDRKAIEQGALQHITQPLVWLEPVDAFFTHIQGSARVRLDNGQAVRVAFAGRNGHPYTPIGKVLIKSGALQKEEVTAETLKNWLRQNPQHAQSVMQNNASFIFFREDSTLKPDDGPRGAMGVALHNKRSLAIDPQFWPYGLPVWVDVPLPVANHPHFRQLVVAQDTGAAIKGATRADIYWGSGAQAGVESGQIKHNGAFIVLLPRMPQR